MKTFQELRNSQDGQSMFEQCFGRSASDLKVDSRTLQEFEAAYDDQIRQLDLEYGNAGERWMYAEKSHEQLLNAVRAIRHTGLTTTRVQARKATEQDGGLLNAEPQYLDSLVDVALRLWLMVNFRSPELMSIGRGRPCVSWRNEETLAQVLGRTFPSSTTELTLSQRRLSPTFTAANMVSICGLQLRWATTIDDHLNLDRQQKTLWVFPMRRLLRLQAKLQEEEVEPPDTETTMAPSCPLPKSIYDETNRTIDLLFPAWDTATKRLLRKQNKDHLLHNSRERDLDLRHYNIWRDRLIELNEDIFLAPPQGWSQLWNDRRDPQKCWTFWIALVVLWLTCVAIVATIVQTWASLSND